MFESRESTVLTPHTVGYGFDLETTVSRNICETCRMHLLGPSVGQKQLSGWIYSTRQTPLHECGPVLTYFRTKTKAPFQFFFVCKTGITNWSVEILSRICHFVFEHNRFQNLLVLCMCVLQRYFVDETPAASQTCLKYHQGPTRSEGGSGKIAKRHIKKTEKVSVMNQTINTSGCRMPQTVLKTCLLSSNHTLESRSPVIFSDDICWRSSCAGYEL